MAMIDKDTGMTDKELDKELEDILSALSVTVMTTEGKIGRVLSILRNIMRFYLKPRVSEAQLKVFAKIDNRIILGDGCLVVFRDFKIEKREVKNIFGKNRIRYYFLDVEMVMFNKEKKYWAKVIKPPLFALAQDGLLLRRLKDWQDMQNSFHAMGVCLRPLAFEFNDYY